MEKMAQSQSPEETARLRLDSILCGILNTTNVYFQPPSTVRMKYPAIVYHLEDIVNVFANNNVYHSRRKYLVTLIVDDPDSPFIQSLTNLPTSRLTRIYREDGLNHYTFTIFY